MASGDWEPDFAALIPRAGEIAPAASKPAGPKVQPPDHGARFVPIDFSTDTERVSVREVFRGAADPVLPMADGPRPERSVSFDSPAPRARAHQVGAAIMDVEEDLPTELGKYAAAIAVVDDGRDASVVQHSALRPGSLSAATPSARRESIAAGDGEECTPLPRREAVGEPRQPAEKRLAPPSGESVSAAPAAKVAKVDQTVLDMRVAVYGQDDAYHQKHQN